MTTQKYKLSLDESRVAAARDIVLRFYRGEALERTPFSFSVPSDKVGGWMHGCPYNFKEMIEDADKAVEGSVRAISHQSEAFPDSDWLPVFHTFYLGEGFVPSMFGARQYVIPEAPPYTEGRILSCIEEVENLPARIDPRKDGWGPIYFDAVEKFLHATDCKVPVSVCDYQSPYGVATKLIGNEELMFAMIDEPELAHRLLNIAADAIIDTVEALVALVGRENVSFNPNLAIPGGATGTILWDDYISVLSPALHTEFCEPANRRVYERFGRGHLHTCGPYFNGYIDAALACGPVTLDISAMRGMAKGREDLLAFRRMTRERGVRIMGGIRPNPVHQCAHEAWEDFDEDFLKQMADGGLLLHDGGDAARGKWVREMCGRIPQKAVRN